MSPLLEFVKELIEGGFIGRAVVGTAVWAVIILLILNHASVDDRLYDAGFVVIGYLFHMAQTASSIRAMVKAQRSEGDCREKAKEGR